MDMNELEELQIILKRDKISYTDIANILEVSPQSIAQTFNKNNPNKISIGKLKDLAAAAGYELKIEYVKK